MSIHKGVVFATALAMTGCSAVGGGGIKAPSASPLPQKYRELDAILAFSGAFSGLAVAERLSECNRLKRNANGHEGVETDRVARIEFALALMLTPECGQLTDALAMLRDARGQGVQTPLRRFVSLQIALLEERVNETERGYEAARKAASLEQANRKLSVQSKARKSELVSVKSVLATLQAKLEALKSMEQTISQRRGNDLK